MLIELCIQGGLIILIMMVLLWLLSLLIKDASIVDIFWGLGFVLVNAFWFLRIEHTIPARANLITVIASLWGLRLFVHILTRNVGKGEDFRYQAWRKQHGNIWWWRSFLQVFLLQGMLMWIISSPLLLAQLSPDERAVGWLDMAGLLIWGYGFFFETAGDWQLRRFKADPANKGKLLTSGVWRYTRHPNYFGDAAQWWGFYLIALAAGGWWTLFSPLLMTYLLVRVSGVAMLEKSLKSEKPGYADYVQRTNAFVPWFPKANKDPE